MTFYNLLSFSDPVLALKLPIPASSPTPYKALIPFFLFLPFFNALYAPAASPAPKFVFFFPLLGFTNGSNLNPSHHILLEMQSIGYCPDSGTCNYLISSLCAVDQLTEAVEVLKGMSGAECVPNLESYDAAIGAMCAVRRTTDVAEKMKEMVEIIGLMPRQEMVVKVVATMRENKEIWRAVEMIEFLEKAEFPVGFESYELVVEGCLECHKFVLAGKVVMRMTGRGFIPYIRVRQKVVEGLASVGELELASAVRQKFVELKSSLVGYHLGGVVVTKII